jgi:hypothetical protein
MQKLVNDNNQVYFLMKLWLRLVEKLFTKISCYEKHAYNCYYNTYLY